MTLPDDPGRWTRGVCMFDPSKQARWEDATIWRRRIGTAEELEAVADAIVRGYEFHKQNPFRISNPFTIVEEDPDGNKRLIVGKVEDPDRSWDQSHGIGEHVVVENLKALIMAVQAHPEVRLAKVNAEEDTDGFLRVHRRWVEDSNGKELEKGTKPTELRLWHSVVARTCGDVETYKDFPIGVTIRSETRFSGSGYFAEACFNGDAVFKNARFSGRAEFASVHFNGTADFDLAHFNEDAGFSLCCFAGEARFGGVRFLKVADFIVTRFSRIARFGGSRFARDGQFLEARFADVAGFWAIRIARSASLRFEDTYFGQSVRFDGAAAGAEPGIEGKVFFTGATLDERLTFDHTRFGEHARLGFNRFLARGGATVELSMDQLQRPRPPSSAHLIKRMKLAVKDYFRFDPSQTIMEGGDSNDPESIVRAADDYQLLAANYARQPAREKEEDNCRWLAHGLRRRAAWCPMKERWPPTKALWVQAGNEVLSFIQTPMDRTSSRLLHGRTEGPLLWYLEYIALIWSCVIAYSTFARRIVSVAWGAVLALTWSFARDGVWEWGIKRTAVGYLLQPHRIPITGAILILFFAGVYGVCINEPGEISHGSFGPEWNATSETFEYQGQAYDYWKKDCLNPLYLSLMTFVTLGYGGFQPAAGWLKLVTGVEGLLGVTLLALFTVAWGRKMVR